MLNQSDKIPEITEANRCIDLRCQGKRGIKISSEDMDFLERMFNEFPEWYASLDKVIFEKTKPFGSI